MLKYFSRTRKLPTQYLSNFVNVKIEKIHRYSDAFNKQTAGYSKVLQLTTLINCQTSFLESYSVHK